MPDSAESLHALGVTAIRNGQPRQAIEFISRAIAADASVARFFSNRGEAYRASGDLASAERDFRQAITLEPGHAIAHYNLGLALRGQDRFDEAIASYRCAIELRPDYVKAHYNLGNALRVRQDYAEAEVEFREAIRLDPSFVEAWNNLGQLLAEQRRVDEAIDAYSRAIELRPDHASSRLNRSMMWLMKGEFERGWEEHEWRWKVPHAIPETHSFAQPAWNGSDLRGKTILLYAEQGLGDTIQFVRYAPMVAARGAGRIILQCQQALAPLLRSVSGLDEVVTTVVAHDRFDTHVALMSLPRVLRRTVSTIPADVPYVRVDAASIEAWNQRIAPHRRKLNVGLVWAGNPSHVHDRIRSASLSRLAGLGGLTDVQFFSLQKGTAAEAELLSRPSNLSIIDLAGDLTNFNDTAAAICNLDAVVSVCTAAAHVAGALARPVILMLFYSGEWRWLMDRQDSPWYPTMKIVQQQQPGDWEGVARRVRELLIDMTLR